MSYDPIVNTSVTLQATSVATQGFGSMLFIDSHNQFFERVREYSSLSAVEVDFPTYSEAYLAASGYFAQQPKPVSIKIGRRRVVSTLTPVVPSISVSTNYKVTIAVTDGVSANISYDAAISATQDAAATAIAAAINAVTGLASKITAAASSGVITITQDAANFDFTLSAVTNMTIGAAASSETAAQVLSAIQAETNAFYAISSSDHSDSFITAMIAAVDGTYNTFWTAQSASANYSPWTNVATDVFAVAKREGHPRTIAFYHHDLTKYPEVRYFAVNASYQPGDAIYMNLPIIGLEASKNASGLMLTETEKSNLHARGINYMDYNFGVATCRDGLSLAQGENTWIDNQIGADLVRARSNEAVFTALINQQGSKYGMDADGHNAVASLIATVLDQMKSSPGKARLLKSYEIFTPNDKDITQAIRASRRATITVRAYLASAIQYVDIPVTLTYAGA